MTDQLSPAAQAVLDTYFGTLSKTPQQSLAAAIRAAADQVKRSLSTSTPGTDWGEGWKEGARNVAQGLESIANELEKIFSQVL